MKTETAKLEDRTFGVPLNGLEDVVTLAMSGMDGIVKGIGQLTSGSWIYELEMYDGTTRLVRETALLDWRETRQQRLVGGEH